MPLRPVADLHPRAGAVVATALLAVSCGARGALPDGAPFTAPDAGRSANGPDAGNGGGGGAPSCGEGVPVLASVVSVPDAIDQEGPISMPLLAWTGTELLLAWTLTGPIEYSLAVAPVHLSGGALSVGAPTRIDITGNPGAAVTAAAWTGAELGVFWGDDTGAIVLRRFDAAAAPLGETTQVVPPNPAYYLANASSVVARDGGFLLAWSTAEPDETVKTFATAVDHDGHPTGSPSLLYVGSAYDGGAILARGAAGTFALWAARPMYPEVVPVTTTLALLDGESGAVQASATVDAGNDIATPSALALVGDEVAAAMFMEDGYQATILTRPAAGGPFSLRASLDATHPAALAADACGRLGALLPTGQLDSDHDVPTGLSFQAIGPDGPMGTPIPLPVTAGDDVSSWTITAVDGGFVASWLDQYAPSPLRLAYLRMP